VSRSDALLSGSSASPEELIGTALKDLSRHSPAVLRRWLDQVHTLRGCSQPVRLVGEKLTLDGRTGEVLSHYSTSAEPHGQLMVRCKNRRHSRCPACSEEYRADTFHLIRSGLAGGKGVPEQVATYPRVLATLTAPPFGAVHSGPGKDGKPRTCHPRRSGPACWRKHKDDDPLIGQPLDSEDYDYVHHVLWNACAGTLWRRFAIYLRRHLAQHAGMTITRFNETVRVSYAKVAEFQKRGVVHFHAVIRLDGRDPHEPPPSWASVEFLQAAIVSAAATVRYHLPGYETALRWGRQVDVRPIDSDLELTEQAVAGYVAKYATKATETAGGLDKPVRTADLARLKELGANPHAACLIRTCWQLGNLTRHPAYAELRLRKWAHMLGFRGHFTTKSRTYSTTYGALRTARAEYRLAQLGQEHDPETTLVINHWTYAGQGFTLAEAALAEFTAGPSTQRRSRST